MCGSSPIPKYIISQSDGKKFLIFFHFSIKLLSTIASSSNIKNGIGKLISGWGAHGYMVRHSTIPKILQMIYIMDAPIDIIYLNNFKNMNVYVSEERLIRGNIQGKNTSDIG